MSNKYVDEIMDIVDKVGYDEELLKDVIRKAQRDVLEEFNRGMPKVIDPETLQPTHIRIKDYQGRLKQFLNKLKAELGEKDEDNE